MTTDDLRHDPVLGLLSDPNAPAARGVHDDIAPLAGKSTLNRLECITNGDNRYHKFSVDKAAMEEVFPKFFVEPY
ncbi:MAG: hypothetical protein AAFW82_00800 [Pseudomonadota bacterium]